MATESTERTIEREADQEPSLAELVGSLSSEVGGLVRAHLDLAITETREEVRKASRAGVMMGAAGVTGLVFLVALTLAAGWGLAETLPAGWAFLIVAGAWGVIALILALVGRSRLERVDPKPDLTIQELKEDGEWIKAQRS